MFRDINLINNGINICLLILILIIFGNSKIQSNQLIL